MPVANQKVDKTRACLWLAILIVAALECASLGIMGCASVNPEPFNKFATSVQSAQIGIDAAMSLNYNWSRETFVTTFSSNPSSQFSQLVIQPGTDYNWKIANPPIYLSVKQARAALAGLNSSFCQYAILLTKLADGSLVNVATFDQMAKDLNTAASESLKTLNLSVPPEGTALFSIAATEAARLYIEKKRRSYLKEAIQKNQENVKTYSGLCISLIQTIRGSIKTFYVDKAEAIRKEWKPSKDKTRVEKTELMLTLNDQFIDALRTLQELEQTYRSLPQANADLVKAIKNPKSNLQGVESLYSSAQRLQRLYNELTKAGK